MTRSQKRRKTESDVGSTKNLSSEETIRQVFSVMLVRWRSQPIKSKLTGFQPIRVRVIIKLKTSFSKLEAELEEAKKREELLKSERDSLKTENEMLKRNQEKQQLQLESIQSQKRRVESQGNHLERKSDSMKLLVEELLSITQQYDQVKL